MMPMKILTDDAWLDALTSRRRPRPRDGQGRRPPHALQPPEEITWITEQAMSVLFERGIFTRNQTVLIRGVNDTPETDGAAREAARIREHAPVLRLHARYGERRRGVAHDDSDRGRHREVRARGDGRLQHAGVHLRCTGRRRKTRRPLVRILRSRERHRVYTAPSVKPDKAFLYFDPIDKLSPDAQARWAVRRFKIR